MIHLTSEGHSHRTRQSFCKSPALLQTDRSVKDIAREPGPRHPQSYWFVLGMVEWGGGVIWNGLQYPCLSQLTKNTCINCLGILQWFRFPNALDDIVSLVFRSLYPSSFKSYGGVDTRKTNRKHPSMTINNTSSLNSRKRSPLSQHRSEKWTGLF